MIKQMHLHLGARIPCTDLHRVYNRRLLATVLILASGMGADASAQESPRPHGDLKAGPVTEVAPVLGLIQRGQAPSDVPILLLGLDARHALTKSEVEEVLGMLEKPMPVSYAEGDAAAIFNELVNLLLRQKPLPEHLGDTLVRVASSEKTAPLIRDYALQQMVYVWWREPRLAQREAMEKALWMAVKQPGRELAGSALLALARLFVPPRAANGLDGKPLTSLDTPEPPDVVGRQVAAVKREEVASEILKILRNKKTHPGVRVSAVRAGVMLSAPGLPGEVLKIAADPNRELRLRMAAISAIGFVGEPESATTVLAKLGENPLLKPATDEAVKMLGHRIAEEKHQR